MYIYCEQVLNNPPFACCTHCPNLDKEARSGWRAKREDDLRRSNTQRKLFCYASPSWRGGSMKEKIAVQRETSNRLWPVLQASSPIYHPRTSYIKHGGKN